MDIRTVKKNRNHKISRPHSVRTDNRKNVKYVVILKGDTSFTLHSTVEEIDYAGKEIAICYSGDNIEEVASIAINIIESAKSVKIVEYNDAVSLLGSEVIPENLKQMIEKAIPLSHDIAELEEILQLAEHEKYPFHITQDFIKGSLYYGVLLNDTINMISSSGELLTFGECMNKGLCPIANDPNTFRFSVKGLSSYLYLKKQVDADILFIELRNYINRYLVLPDQKASSFLALWIMGTYLFRLFRHYPYVHVNAEKGSGKSTLIQILEPIAFNGKSIIDATGPALFHEIHRNGSTLFIDEAETLGGKSVVKSSIASVLNAGYSSGVTVSRANRDYYVYSPKMFAGIYTINDTLASRSVKVKLMRRLSEEKAERYVDSPSMQAYHQELRDKLYIFGLQNASIIYDRYSRNLAGETAYRHLENRAFDIWAPIFLIAEVVDNSSDTHTRVLNEMVELSKHSIEERKKDDEANNELVDLLNSWDEMKNTVKPVRRVDHKEYYLTDDVYEHARKFKLVSAGTSKTGLTQLLRRLLDAETKVVKHNKESKRVYIINTKRESELKLRYGLSGV